MAAKRDQTPLAVLVRGAEKTFDNAERIFYEAELLAKAGAVARALCLHQISLEECSKVNNLGAWAVSLVLGIEVDQKKVPAAFGRRRILELLGPGEMASGQVVEAIGAEFGITQAAVSQHLKVLRESGFARVRPEAQRRLYSVDAAGFQAVDAWIGQFRSFWEPKLDALATEIARGKRKRRGAPMAGQIGRRA
jgi:DNA-binding transcriptional ArsR family regulator